MRLIAQVMVLAMSDSVFEPLDPAELVWGARAISQAIGRTEAATFHALERDQLPGAKRCGGRWCLNVRAFRAAFDAPAPPKRVLVNA
jgi:hypothetical protein